MSKMFKVVTVVDNTALARQMAHDVLHESLEDITEDCLTEANVTIPHDTGMMQDSGFAEVDGLEGQVAYDTPYTVEQHENSSIRHDNGRRDHWLSLTVEENAARWEQWLAAKAKAKFR